MGECDTGLSKDLYRTSDNFLRFKCKTGSIALLEPEVMSDLQTQKIDYGNWVSKKLIYIPLLLAVIFLGLSFISLFFLFGMFFLIPAAYFVYAYFQFSPRGGNLQAKIRDLVLKQLVWNGDGTLLDIGCGNGALVIEAAKRYPQSQVTGIDYWGAAWEYSKKSCEENAQIAGVGERASFQKASAAKLPFEDEFFKVAVSNFVFHEVREAKDKKDVIKGSLKKTGNSYSMTFSY
jgi:SAM-dependent methyltransferase